jgi:hypothetical protein
MSTGLAPVNKGALEAAREIWLPMAPEEMKAARNDQPEPPPWPAYADFTAYIVANIVTNQPCVRFPPKIWRDLTRKLRSHGAQITHVASTGALVLAYIISAFPKSQIRLYGFTHQGWDGHPWSAEATWISTLPNVRYADRKASDSPPWSAEDTWISTLPNAQYADRKAS